MPITDSDDNNMDYDTQLEGRDRLLSFFLREKNIIKTDRHINTPLPHLKSVLTSLNDADLFLCPCLCASRAPGFFLGNSPHVDLHYEPPLGASYCSHVTDLATYHVTDVFF